LNTSTRSDRPAGEIEDVDKKSKQKGKKGKLAVEGTSFGVKKGECFSLLGVNGAGKTSTFNCLVGQEDISGGKVMIDSTDIGKLYRKPDKLFNLVGYCP